MDEIMTELQNMNDPKTLFKYCSTIEEYFKDKNSILFGDFVRAKNLDLPILDRIADKIDNIKRKNQRDGRIDNNTINTLLAPLKKRIINLINNTEILKNLANNNTENGLSQILNYDNLYLCAEYIAINLVLIGASKNNVYDLLNIFKNPNIETAIKEDISLIKPLFAIGLASVQGLNEDTLNLFFGIANKVKSIDDLKLLKLFIEAISVYFDSYSKGGNK